MRFIASNQAKCDVIHNNIKQILGYYEQSVQKMVQVGTKCPWVGTKKNWDEGHRLRWGVQPWTKNIHKKKSSLVMPF